MLSTSGRLFAALGLLEIGVLAASLFHTLAVAVLEGFSAISAFNNLKLQCLWLCGSITRFLRKPFIIFGLVGEPEKKNSSLGYNPEPP